MADFGAAMIIAKHPKRQIDNQMPVSDNTPLLAQNTAHHTD
jgi:hypothetical protein